MFTTGEAADALGVSGRYLTRLLNADRLPYRMAGDAQLIPPAAVRAFKVERDRTLHELNQLATAEERLGVRRTI